MTDSHRKLPRGNPPGRDPSEARPESDSHDRPNQTEFRDSMLERLDELTRQRAEMRGLSVEEMMGGRRWRRAPPDRPKIARSKPKPEPTPEQKAALEAFQRLSRDSETLH